MKISQLLKHPLISGTLLLTAAGIISRVIGFFYRIFLSRTIGAEGLGLYQLVFPLLGVCFSLSSAGIQTAVSRFVAEAVGSCPDAPSGEKTARRYLQAGIFLSCLISLFCGFFLWENAGWLSLRLLGDVRCEALIRIMTLSLLPAGIHSCINGYYYGRKKALVPSVSQLAEQLARVFGVYLIYLIVSEQNCPLNSVHAIWGMVIGECAGLVVSVTAAGFSRPGKSALRRREALRRVFFMALPLTANHTLVHICGSFENLLIPRRLQLYGYSAAQSLEIFGVLSGMALSIIFFPGVLTNSFSVLLLPAISEAAARKNEKLIAAAIRRAVFYGLLLGFAFTALFLLTGGFIGNRIFGNALAGNYIRRLSWLCPMMYVYGLLSSILHGLGSPKSVLFINLLASLIRIGAVWFLVPVFGIGACLWGMLLSQLFSAAAAIVLLSCR